MLCSQVSINIDNILQNIELGLTFRQLDCHAGTGVSGFRNGHLMALTRDSADGRANTANTVIPLFEQFTMAYVNAELPAWFYFVFTSVKEITD